MIGVSISTLQNWEQERRQPEGSPALLCGSRGPLQEPQALSNAANIPSAARTAALNVGGVPMPARTAAVATRAAMRSLDIAARNAAGGTVAADDARVGTDTRAQSPAMPPTRCATKAGMQTVSPSPHAAPREPQATPRGREPGRERYVQRGADRGRRQAERGRRCPQRKRRGRGREPCQEEILQHHGNHVQRQDGCVRTGGVRAQHRGRRGRRPCGSMRRDPGRAQCHARGRRCGSVRRLGGCRTLQRGWRREKGGGA